MDAPNIIKTCVSVAELKNGDTVEIDGNLSTVSRRHLKHCPFMGCTFKGDCFVGGIIRITFKVPTAHGHRYE